MDDWAVMCGAQYKKIYKIPVLWGSGRQSKIDSALISGKPHSTSI